MQPLPYAKLSPSPRLASLGSLAEPQTRFGERQGLGRTASLSSLGDENQLTRARDNGDREEYTKAEADERELSLIEDVCRRRLQRCNAHEKAIQQLRDEIEGDLEEWDSLLDNLAEADQSAQILTDQIQSSLSTLRQTSQPAVAAARRELAEAHERVQVTNKDIDEADTVIKQAHSMVSVIEARIKAERLVQSKMNEYNTIGFWLVGLGLFAVAVGLIWLLVPVKAAVRLVVGRTLMVIEQWRVRWASEL